MDVLSDVIRVVRLSGAVFFTAEFSSPWALESPNSALLADIVMPDAECVVLFHILTEGACIVECEGCPPARMDANDVIVFPHGEPHTMRSDERAEPTRMDAVFPRVSEGALPRVTFGGGGRTSQFICGYLNCDQRFAPLLSTLPTMLLVRSRDGATTLEATDRGGRRPTSRPVGSATWLGTTLKYTMHEARAGRPGNAAMLGRLTELMFVEILREYMQQMTDDRGGWLAGLKDPYVGKALRLMHAHPMRSWTVDGLAREAALSRSALAQRFTDLVGEAPMRYLANWRMQLAKEMLREGVQSIQEIAARVGYESEPAFNRAFKRATGFPPALWRRGVTSASQAASGIGPMRGAI
ncbi:MAG: AraC family transcriptional regulator [Vicinamibacteraceae bacterium]